VGVQECIHSCASHPCNVDVSSQLILHHIRHATLAATQAHRATRRRHCSRRPKVCVAVCLSKPNREWLFFKSRPKLN